MRVSASLVGAGRGNGATAKPGNRTTSLSEVRGGPILYQVFQLIWYQLFVSAQTREAHFYQKSSNVYYVSQIISKSNFDIVSNNLDYLVMLSIF